MSVILDKVGRTMGIGNSDLHHQNHPEVLILKFLQLLYSYKTITRNNYYKINNK